MRHNEQPPLSPEQIAIMTAAIRANWTPEEEQQRRVVKVDSMTVVVPLGSYGHDGHDWLVSA